MPKRLFVSPLTPHPNIIIQFAKIQKNKFSGTFDVLQIHFHYHIYKVFMEFNVKMVLMLTEQYLFPNHNFKSKSIVYGNKRFLKVISYNYISPDFSFMSTIARHFYINTIRDISSYKITSTFVLKLKVIQDPSSYKN